jgi:hypothetical protein
LGKILFSGCLNGISAFLFAEKGIQSPCENRYLYETKYEIQNFFGADVARPCQREND